jgi:peptidoglycan/xylan/chitin deacetylase (PgdA/CDA1 family)
MKPRLSRIAARGIAAASSFMHIGRAPRPGLRVLMYHSVGSRATGDALGIYGISPDLFARHMAALAAHADMTPVALGATPPRGTQVAVTFDDGYRDNLTRAAPVLQRHGIPFTVFVCSAFLHDTSGNFLTVAGLRELAALPGVSIGSHGATHVPLNGLDDARLHDELRSSKAALEDATGRPVQSISYPHGAVDRRVRDAAAAAGYTVGACSRFDINDIARDPLLLCRTDIHSNDTQRVFEQKLRGDWDWYRWRSTDPAMS